MSVTISGDGTITGLDADGISSQPVFPGNVLQVIQTVKTDTFSTTSTTPVDVTGMSVSITPSSASNKILIICQVTTGGVDKSPRVNLVRGSTAIMQPDDTGATLVSDARLSNVRHGITGIISFLDSPNTTSSTTYKLQMFNGLATDGGTVLFNQSGFTEITGGNYRGTSSITVMEIAA
jgi:hypothetical protein